MIKINGSEIVFDKFPNGETNMKVDNLNFKETSIQDIRFKYENDSDLMKLLFVKNYLDEVKPNGEANLVIYYMPYSRQDRSENGSPLTLKYVSSFINSLNFNKVTVLEPHSDVTCAVLNRAKAESIVFNLLSDVIKDIKFDIERDYIVFPDTTSSKRYADVKSSKRLTGIKHRNFQTGRIESLELAGTVEEKGFKALLVDDLSSYGGTFLMTANKLKEMGASEIYMLVGHCENSIFEGDVLKTDLINKVFTTDTLLTKHNDWSNIKFKEKIKIYCIEEVLNEKYDN